MEQWNDTTEHSAGSFNGGNKYTVDDQMSIEALNNNIENSLYAIRVAKNAQSATNNAVSYDEQTPTISEQAQARTNINAVAKDASDLNGDNIENWQNKLGGYKLLYDGGNTSHSLSTPITLSENIQSTDILLIVVNRRGYIVAGSSYQSSQSFSYTISSYGGISSVEFIVAWSDNSNSLSISGISWNCEVNNTNNTAKMTATDLTTLRIGKIYKLVYANNASESSSSTSDNESVETGGTPIG